MTTFTETRELEYAYEPYVSGDIVSKGDRTLPWSFVVTPKKLFHNEIVRKEVENTSHLEVGSYFIVTYFPVDFEYI